MPPLDRHSALRAIDKAVRQGRLEAAITEYLRILEAYPTDWNSANALGDLYIKARQIDKGVAQYARIADHLAREGFHAKASALYKKVLKIKPDDEYALLQSGEMAARLGLFADATAAFRTVKDQRLKRGDAKGASALDHRIATLATGQVETVRSGDGGTSAFAEATADKEVPPSSDPSGEPSLSPVGNGGTEVPPSKDQQTLDDVFDQLRQEAEDDPSEQTAAEQHRLALTYVELGMVEDAIHALEAATESPRQRFAAASRLGKLHLDGGDPHQAIGWFERALEGPAPNRDASHALLYDLAATLESVGERSRALAVFLELQGEARGYRDVATRIDRLSQFQPKG